MNQEKSRKIISVALIICIVFLCFDFVATEITDKFAYKDAVVDETEWNAVYDKILTDEQLSDRDYEVIFEQSGLGRPAVDSLINENRIGDFEYYRNYYLRDKDFTCVRTAIFAKHEAVTDNEGNRILNPEFADIQNGVQDGIFRLLQANQF